MCRIAGYFSCEPLSIELQDKVFDISTELFKECIVQGRDAAGFAFFDEENHIKYAKGPVTSEELVLDPKWLKVKEFAPRMLVMHTRFGTKGSEFDNNNNHPLIIEEEGVEQLALIHNGCISSDDAIRKDNPDFTWKAEVDTEVIPVLIQENIKKLAKKGEITKELIQEAIQEATKELSGSFACAMLNKNTPDSLYLFKHMNPIVLAYCKELKTVFFASTSDIINKAFALGGENVKEDMNVFVSYKLDYTLYEMKEDELFVFTRKTDKVTLDQGKFKAKEYVYTGQTWSGHGQGGWFDSDDYSGAEYSGFEGGGAGHGYESRRFNKLKRV